MVLIFFYVQLKLPIKKLKYVYLLRIWCNFLRCYDWEEIMICEEAFKSTQCKFIIVSVYKELLYLCDTKNLEDLLFLHYKLRLCLFCLFPQSLFISWPILCTSYIFNLWCYEINSKASCKLFCLLSVSASILKQTEFHT